LYDVQSIGAQAYIAVADELMRREMAPQKERHSDIIATQPPVTEANA